MKTLGRRRSSGASSAFAFSPLLRFVHMGSEAAVGGVPGRLLQSAEEHQRARKQPRTQVALTFPLLTRATASTDTSVSACLAALAALAARM
jgi:hypothetical protein